MKLRLIILACLVCLIAACGKIPNIHTDAEKVNQAAAEIADFTLPDGYQPEFTASAMGYTLVGYEPGDGASHLYLVQAQDQSFSKDIDEVIDEMVPGKKDRKNRVTIVENRSVTVRGKPCTLVLSEGINGEGKSFRQAVVAFEGKGGPAVLVFSEPAATWDLERVDALIASFK